MVHTHLAVHGTHQTRRQSSPASRSSSKTCVLIALSLVSPEIWHTPTWLSTGLIRPGDLLPLHQVPVPMLVPVALSELQPPHTTLRRYSLLWAPSSSLTILEILRYSSPSLVRVPQVFTLHPCSPATYYILCVCLLSKISHYIPSHALLLRHNLCPHIHIFISSVSGHNTSARLCINYRLVTNQRTNIKGSSHHELL